MASREPVIVIPKDKRQRSEPVLDLHLIGIRLDSMRRNTDHVRVVHNGPKEERMTNTRFRFQPTLSSSSRASTPGIPMLSVLGRRKDWSRGPWTLTPSPRSAARRISSRRARMAARCFDSLSSSTSTICRENGHSKRSNGRLGRAFSGTLETKRGNPRAGVTYGQEYHCGEVNEDRTDRTRSTRGWPHKPYQL